MVCAVSTLVLVSVLLSISVERFFVSRMQDFFYVKCVPPLAPKAYLLHPQVFNRGLCLCLLVSSKGSNPEKKAASFRTLSKSDLDPPPPLVLDTFGVTFV